MSAHYEERMEADLGEIRRKLHKVSEMVEYQLQMAVQSLLHRDRDAASNVVLGDRQVNRRIKQIDELCHAFIVRHAPSAGHLRFVSAVLRLDVALERIGDYASEIGRQVARIANAPSGTVARDLDLIAQQTRHTLSEALKSFHAGDVEAAQTTYGLASQTDLTLDKVIAELLRTAEKKRRPLVDVFALLRSAKLLKRVADQSENICDQTVFAVTGDSPDAKVFRVLFVDAHNDRSSQIAEAYARKAFPESGTYESAGWTPTRALDPALCAFMDSKGVDVRPAVPSALAPAEHASEHFNVIVLLTPDGREHLGEVPYRTTVLEWELKRGDGMSEETLEDLYKDVALHVRDLMTTLAGPDAR